MAAPDVIVIGSGINGLVCAAMAGRKGKRVLLLEREDEIGGTIKTGAITAPGFKHDIWAATWVLFITGPAYAALGERLEHHGLKFAFPEHPTGVLRPDGSVAVLTTDRSANVAMFEALADGDGAAFRAAVETVERNAPLVFSLLGQRLWGWSTARMLAAEAWRRGARGLAAFFGAALAPARAWLETEFRSETSRALFAPWVLHTGLGPDSAYSAEMARVIGFALEAAGAPIVEGGGARAVDAFKGVIRACGGEIRTGADVEEILVRGGEVTGVRLAGGEEIAARTVVASVTPTQLYDRLLSQPKSASQQSARRYRYGKGNFMLHYALSQPPAWTSPGLEKVALLHLTDGVDAVSKAANEAERGMLPEVPTICVGQPTALDPSRAPAGKATLWVQMPEAPRHIKGDAAGHLDTPVDGAWTEVLREAYADRVEAILARHIEGFRDSIIARRAYSPADHEAANINLVGGDPYGGYCGLDQFFIWRPFKGSVNHKTEVRGLWHIGASTHPGPGLGGGSGYLVAARL